MEAKIPCIQLYSLVSFTMLIITCHKLTTLLKRLDAFKNNCTLVNRWNMDTGVYSWERYSTSDQSDDQLVKNSRYIFSYFFILGVTWRLDNTTNDYYWSETLAQYMWSLVRRSDTVVYQSHAWPRPECIATKRRQTFRDQDRVKTRTTWQEIPGNSYWGQILVLT